jgi:16S rRNA G966 N2-methylase RsmD
MVRASGDFLKTFTPRDGDEGIRKLMAHEIISTIFVDPPFNRIHIVA